MAAEAIAEPDWPSYDVPEGVGGGEPAAQPPADGGQPPAGEPASQPTAGASGTPAGQPAAQPPAGEPAAGRQLPDYRVETILRREAAAQAENTRLKNIIGQALGLTADGTPKMDPKTSAIRTRLFEVMPELKDILEQIHPKLKAITGLADQAPAWTEQNTAYWQGVAGRTVSTVYDGVAKLVLGSDKTGKDLDPEFAEDVRDGFIRWVERDNTGQRVVRYEGQDPSLVAEFLKAFTARYVDPVRRSATAGVVTRGERVAALPVAGGSGAPRAAAPPAVNPDDEDAVHGRGWAVAQQLRGQPGT
jgi:hypothetical protein